MSWRQAWAVQWQPLPETKTSKCVSDFPCFCLKAVWYVLKVYTVIFAALVIPNPPFVVDAMLQIKTRAFYTPWASNLPPPLLIVFVSLFQCRTVELPRALRMPGECCLWSAIHTQHGLGPFRWQALGCFPLPAWMICFFLISNFLFPQFCFSLLWAPLCYLNSFLIIFVWVLNILARCAFLESVKYFSR